MKNLLTQGMGKLSMRNIYGAKNINSYDNENMPGGGNGTANKPPKEL